MDAIEFLRRDHEEVLAMLDELERLTADGPAATPEEEAARKRLVTELVMAESSHEAVEEQYFWPSVRHWLDEGGELAGTATGQEQAAKHVLAELETVAPHRRKFEELAATVVAEGREHIAYEEREVWPAVRQRIARSELDDVGRKMARAKNVAPTRPHPHTPPKPGVLKSAGVAAAATDKLRDAASGRGKDDR